MRGPRGVMESMKSRTVRADAKEIDMSRDNFNLRRRSRLEATQRKGLVSLSLGAILGLFCAGAGLVADEEVVDAGTVVEVSDLALLSIEQLMDIEVTSVSRRQEKLLEAPSAVFVITQEDIRRSGLQLLPEVLRMVPGLQVARIDANKWAITARGFNGRFANKLLVLIDGRTVYSPIFSGTYWDLQDLLIEDVDRIEVIRGPGAAAWGANAVNGVISIITKKASDTQGALVTGGGGTDVSAWGGARYGGKLGDALHYRVYAKYLLHDDTRALRGGDAVDEWDAIRGGFRLEWTPGEDDELTVQGDLYSQTFDSTANIATLTSPFSETINDTGHAVGGNLLARWTHTISETSQSALQVYYDRADRNESILESSIDTIDIDFQHSFQVPDWMRVTWGLGYRHVEDRLGSSIIAKFDPATRGTDLFSAFVQDEITVVPDRVRLTLGTKIESNSYTGFEVQPNGRILWTPDDRHTVWGAVSRAVRTPSRGEVDARLNVNGSPGTLAVFSGNRDFKSEELLAFEIGYRIRPCSRLFVDVATFYNRYDNLRGVAVGTPFFEAEPAPPHAVVPLPVSNLGSADTYGVELASQAELTNWWRVQGSFTFLTVNARESSKAAMDSADTTEGGTPTYQASVRSSFDLPHDLQLDAQLFYVDHLPAYDVHSYIRMDLRLGWKPCKSLELAVGVQNLLDELHPEFGSEFLTSPTELERAFFGTMTWKF